MMININDNFECVLSEAGAKQVQKTHDKFKAYSWHVPKKYVAGQFYSSQLWGMFQIFGPHINAGSQVFAHECQLKASKKDGTIFEAFHGYAVLANREISFINEDGEITIKKFSEGTIIRTDREKILVKFYVHKDSGVVNEIHTWCVNTDILIDINKARPI